MSDSRWVYRDYSGTERVLAAPTLSEAQRRVIRAEEVRGVESIAARNVAAQTVRPLKRRPFDDYETDTHRLGGFRGYMS